MTPTCWWMIGQFFDTTIVESTNMEWLYLPMKFYFMESAILNCFRPCAWLNPETMPVKGVTSQPFWVSPRVLSGALHDFLNDCWQSFAVYPQILLPLPSPPPMHTCLTVHSVSICVVSSIPFTVSVWRCMLVAAQRVAWHQPQLGRISALLHHWTFHSTFWSYSTDDKNWTIRDFFCSC